MGHIRPYDREEGVALLKRALDRSGYPAVITLREFAREELVRNEGTLHAYLHGRAIPAVVREKLKKLARRRRRATNF